MLRLKPRKVAGRKKAYYCVWGVGPDGHFYRESLGTDRRSEAEPLFDRRVKEIWANHERVGTGGDLPLADVIDAYLASTNKRGEPRDPRFLDKILLKLGEKRVSELTEDAIMLAGREVYPKALASTFNRQWITPLNAVISWGANSKRRICPHLDIDKLVERSAEEKRAAPPEWIEAFVRQAARMGHVRLAAMEVVMAMTGARRGSCFRLDWRDVDAENCTVLFRRTKTGKDVVGHLTRQAMDLLLAIAPLEGRKGLVFGFQLDKHGKPHKSFYIYWREICEAACIDYIPPHQSGRHTFATRVIVDAGIDAYTAARMGGWSSTAMLERYVHARDAKQVVGVVFGEGSKHAPAISADCTKTAPRVLTYDKNPGNTGT